MTPSSQFFINDRKVSNDSPTYFIADIAANHDGNLQQAIELIHSAAKAGADAAKFQHFRADTIVSDLGFKQLGGQQSHQSKWKKSVFEVYKEASINTDWNSTLREECDKAGIAFFTSPYSIELVDQIDSLVPAYKVGSGDITWTEIIQHIARKNKPYFIATGASNFEDVVRAVSCCIGINPNLSLMQCNTNYTGSLENFKYIQLNVLRAYREMFPNLILGLSDHTPGHSTVLGAIALGARVVEKHFTLDKAKEGPDHAFSMSPSDWHEMVCRSRELENALGNGIKKIEDNELETVLIQRRSIRTTRAIKSGETLSLSDLTFLRPCPEDGIPPYMAGKVIEKKLTRDIAAGEHITLRDLKS